MSRWNFEKSPEPSIVGEAQRFFAPRPRRFVGELVIRDGEAIRVLPPSKAGRVSIDNVRGGVGDQVSRGDVGTSPTRKHMSDMNRP